MFRAGVWKDEAVRCQAHRNSPLYRRDVGRKRAPSGWHSWGWEQSLPLLHRDERGSVSKVRCTGSGELIRGAAALGQQGSGRVCVGRPATRGLVSSRGAGRCSWDTPHRSDSSRLVLAGCSANGGTEPEVVGRALSQTVGLGPRRRLTHSAAHSTGQGLGA